MDESPLISGSILALDVKQMHENYKAVAPKGYVLTGTADEQKTADSFRDLKPYI